MSENYSSCRIQDINLCRECDKKVEDKDIVIAKVEGRKYAQIYHEPCLNEMWRMGGGEYEIIARACDVCHGLQDVEGLTIIDTGTSKLLELCKKCLLKQEPGYEIKVRSSYYKKDLSRYKNFKLKGSWGERRTWVWLNDEVLPTLRASKHYVGSEEFDWGYVGASPYLLAVAVLLEILPVKEAGEKAHSFMKKYLAPLEMREDFEITFTRNDLKNL